MTTWRSRGSVLLLVALGLSSPARVAQAAEITDVIDAFDVDDVFDFTFRVTYGYQLQRIKITQQCPPGEADALGCVPDRRGVISFRDVARYNHERHTLTLDAVFGLYRDLQFYTSWPLILLDRQEFSFLEDSAVQDVHLDNQYVLRVPFRAPDRSGIDTFSVGLSWLPFSQERNETLPTWLIDFQAHFAIGPELRPGCRATDGSVPQSTDAGADGRWYTRDDSVEQQDCATEDRGMSPRTTNLRLQMTLARRFGIVEPYMGFTAIISIPDQSSGIPWSDWNNTPLYAETHFGFELIPWEREEARQFFRIGLHFWGGWNRETLNYGPLFDLLGTNPNMAYDWDPIAPPRDRGDDRDYSGLTRIESYGTFGGRLTLTLQAARYVKFSLGIGIAHDQEHYISFSDMCRVPGSDESPDATGPCAETQGIVVPETRRQIDDIGRRLRAEETTIFEAFARAFVQF